MAGLLAVLVAMSLATVMSIAYALILRELQRINANLEGFIKLIVDARQREDARQRDDPITHDSVAPATRRFPTLQR
jgi:type II secretory pathway component PulJ